MTIVRASSPSDSASRVMLRKPGPATSTALMPGVGPQPGGDRLGDLARRRPAALASRMRDVGRVIAVFAAFRALEDDLGRDVAGEVARIARLAATAPARRTSAHLGSPAQSKGEQTPRLSTTNRLVRRNRESSVALHTHGTYTYPRFTHAYLT